MWLLPVFSGFLIGTSYIPFPPWASLFCFIPLWIFWYQQQDLKKVVLGGWITSFVFTLIGFNWVAYLLHEFAHLNWPLSVVGMLLFAVFAHLFVPFAGAVWFLLQKKLQVKEMFSYGLMALITVLCEFYSPTLFDWNFGYSWYGANLPIYQWAEFVGFSGLSSLTLLLNLPLLWAWKKRRETSGKLILMSVITAFIVLNAGGERLKERLPAPDDSFNVLLVQANIGNFEKQAAELGRGFRSEIIKRYEAVTDRGLKAHPNTRIDFALWPETAFPAGLGERFKHQRYAQQLKQFLKDRHLPLITGAFDTDLKTGLITNSLFVLNKEGDIVPPHYSKSILLAFGEYIPGEEIFPVIREWLPPTGQFARGPGPTMLLSWNGYKIGPQICYESLFPGFSKALADLGAQFIVNATNDSWYGTWQEPYQHMYMTLARGVEFRRPVLRVTNTGISTVGLASGEILERSPLQKEWAGLYTVPYLKEPKPTFYQRWFRLVPSVLWISLVLLVVAGMWSGAKRRS